MGWTIVVPETVREKIEEGMYAERDKLALTIISKEVEAAKSLNDMRHIGETISGRPAFYIYQRILLCEIHESSQQIVIKGFSQ